MKEDKVLSLEVPVENRRRTMHRVADYKEAIANLGVLPSMLDALQKLRLFMKINRPVSLYSKYAQFPVKCRPNTSDNAVFNQIFVRRQYRCLDDIRGARLIIDCGANVGYSSAYLLSRLPNSYTIAIEPDPGNFTILKTNLASYEGRYRAICSAVWSHPVGLVLSEKTFRDGREWARTVREARQDEKPAIFATDIGMLLKESGFERISILKIDIEGAEAAVFSCNYEPWIAKVDNLVVELHDDNCSSIFRKAISTQEFFVSRCGELTVCKRLSNRS